MSASIHCMDRQSAAPTLVPAKLAAMTGAQLHVGVNRVDVRGVECWMGYASRWTWSTAMNPELVQTMRAALEAVMARVPAEQSVFGLKAAMAEVILKAAAHGHTSFDGLVASASGQLQSVISMLT
jgi:hypothetical protein